MSQTLVNINMDEDLVNFDVSTDPFYSESNMNVIRESMDEIKQGKIVVKTMEELEAMENE